MGAQLDRLKTALADRYAIREQGAVRFLIVECVRRGSWAVIGV